MSNVTAVPIRPIKRSIVLWIVAGVLFAAAVGGWLAWAGTNPVIAAKGTTDQFLAWNAGRSGVVTTPSGLQYRDLGKGDGKAHPTDGDVAYLEYTGKLRDGTVFDKSERPVELPVAGVVPGFSEALKLMTRGAKLRAWIKPELGYGGEDKRDPAGKIAIPANSVLDFEIKLIDFMPEAAYRQMKMQQMMLQQGGGAPGGMPGALPPGALPPGAMPPGALPPGAPPPDGR